MWQMLMTGLVLAAPTSDVGSIPPGGSVVEGMAFGPRLTLTCAWFTNFENSRFERCRASAKSLLPSDEGASIKCVGRTCEQLDAEARRVSHWRKPEPPWGRFTVRLIGRVSVHRHSKQYLG